MVNRIIGILVLLSIAVLLAPFLVSHYDASSPTEMVMAPPFPNPQDQNNTIQALGEHSKAMASIAAKNAKVKAHATKLADSTVLDSKHLKANLKTAAWVIQVGSYKEKLGALRLVNELRAKGYNAFIHQKSAAFGDEVKVFIGPEVKRDSAESIASKLTRETKLFAVVRSYKPLAA